MAKTVLQVYFVILHPDAKWRVINVPVFHCVLEIRHKHVRQTQPGGSDQLWQDQAEEDGDAGEKSSAIKRE